MVRRSAPSSAMSLPEQRVDERGLARVELAYDDEQEQLFEVLVRPPDEANVLRWRPEVLEEGYQPLEARSRSTSASRRSSSIRTLMPPSACKHYIRLTVSR